jgi:hypothetical protein
MHGEWHEIQFHAHIHDVIAYTVTCQTLHIIREKAKWGVWGWRADRIYRRYQFKQQKNISKDGLSARDVTRLQEHLLTIAEQTDCYR